MTRAQKRKVRRWGISNSVHGPHGAELASKRMINTGQAVRLKVTLLTLKYLSVTSDERIQLKCNPSTKIFVFDSQTYVCILRKEDISVIECLRIF